MARHGPRLLTKTVTAYAELMGRAHGVPSAQFLDPRLADLANPEGMIGRDVLAKRLGQAIRARERVVVFGDYDCDGMTATAILCDVIEALGGTAYPLIASRFDGGYGVSERARERIMDLSPSLLVTCDCGSSDHETLQKLTDAGVDVGVIDHHLVPERPLPALAFLNPHRPECEFPYKGLASCGLALSVAAALRAELGAKLDVRNWLDLVAIGTIADVAPLTRDNRALVRAGLSVLRTGERPGLRSLMDLIKLDRTYPLTATDVSFRIAPRLNAPGRLGPPDPAFQLLREKDPSRARDIADQVEHLCQTRRADQRAIEEQALLDAQQQKNAGAVALVVGREGWNHGIVGIVAGRIAEKFELPTCVIGFDEGIGRGSLRGPDGFPLFDALSEASAWLVRFGGHQAAAGLEIRAENLEQFRATFQKACLARSNYVAPKAREPLAVQSGDSLKDVLSDLYLLEPCGEQNPAPVLRMTGTVRSAREVKGGHLKLELELASGVRVGGFGPGLGEQASRLEGDVAVLGELRPDNFRGGDSVELLVRKVESLSF